jgi:hypothetical protein
VTEHNMRHLDFIRIVAEEDLAYVDRKDRQYGGSWKRRGGVGAFMMLARKWDRLENMLGQVRSHPPQFNVFDYITSQTTSGEDGTVLAEVRDLRRYLLLVEAEMMARGVVPVPAPKVGVDTSSRIEITHASVGDVSRTDVVIHDADADESHHSSEAPWRVPQVLFERWFDPSVRELADRFYDTVGSERWRKLLPIVQASNMPRRLHEAYDMHRNGAGIVHWILRVDRVPESLRDDYPRLQREMNQKEFEESNQAFSFMYTHSTTAQKWLLTGQYDAWGREA